MYHFIYKTYSESGKFYIGRHSTENIDDGYIGSGKWVRQYKNKNLLKRDILEYAENQEDLRILEETFINRVLSDPLNMNYNNKSTGFAVGDLNPAKSEKERLRRSEENWTKTDSGRKWMSDNNPSRREDVKIKRRAKSKEQWLNGTHNFLKEDVIAKKIAATIHRNKTDNPMWRPEVVESVSISLRQRYVDGIHNFCDPDNNRKAIEARRLVGSHKWTDEEKYKMKVPKEKVTCLYCNISGGKPVMMRYHFTKCKSKVI